MSKEETAVLACIVLVVAALIGLVFFLPESADGLGPSAPVYTVTALGPDLRPVRTWTTRKRPKQLYNSTTSPVFTGRGVGFATTSLPTGEIEFTDDSGETFTLPKPWKVEPAKVASNANW